MCYHCAVNSKHRKTLQAVFANPVSGTIKWGDIECLLDNIGCQLVEGDGSRVRVVFGEQVAVFHRPHPRPETDKGAVKALRMFLIAIGVEP